MSFTNYQQLQQKSAQDPRLVGNRLPQLNAVSLEITAQEINLSEVCTQIREFNANAGWVMFRNRLEINNVAPEQDFILEGEWSNGEHSLSVKLLQDDCYVLTRFITTESQQSTIVNTEQILYLRPELKSQTDANACRYRLWWQQAEEGTQKGRWLPLAQQFIGFTQAEDIEQSSKGGE